MVRASLPKGHKLHRNQQERPKTHVFLKERTFLKKYCGISFLGVKNTGKKNELVKLLQCGRQFLDQSVWNNLHLLKLFINESEKFRKINLTLPSKVFPEQTSLLNEAVLH